MNELSNEMKEALRKTVEELKKMTTPQLARKLNEHSLTPFAKTIDLLTLNAEDYELLARYSTISVVEIMQHVLDNEYSGLPALIQIIKWFEGTHYQQYIKIREYDRNFIYVTINTPNILIGFCNAHDEDPTDGWPSYLYINGRICFDHEKLYDKWSNAHQPYFFPQTKEQFNNLLKIIDYVGTDEYYNFCCDTDDEHNTDEMEAVYKACEDFADWSNYVEDCIPSHLRELFKSDE